MNVRDACSDAWALKTFFTAINAYHPSRDLTILFVGAPPDDVMVDIRNSVTGADHDIYWVVKAAPLVDWKEQCVYKWFSQFFLLLITDDYIENQAAYNKMVNELKTYQGDAFKLVVYDQTRTPAGKAIVTKLSPGYENFVGSYANLSALMLTTI